MHLDFFSCLSLIQIEPILRGGIVQIKDCQDALPIESGLLVGENKIHKLNGNAFKICTLLEAPRQLCLP